MECIVEMYFPDRTDHNLILDALRYWVMSFHVDGFKLLGDRLPVTAIVQDALLSRTKILYDGFDMSVVPQNRTYENLYIDKEEYQFAARMMLNHINCNMYELLNQQKKQGENVGFINYISSNNGFTLSDLFMYNDRHNEANGEKNADGPSWNFSNNYGCEGPSRKRFIREIRKLKWKDAMLLLFLAQGVPMIMAGNDARNSLDA
jgi:glycogen operon protein